MAEGKKYTSVDEYLNDFSGETKTRLVTLRKLIKQEAPDATERISYNIPAAFIDKTIIVYYSGYAHHVSLYPGRIQTEKLDPALRPYFSGKSTLKFPNNAELPVKDIEKYIKARVALARR